MIESMKWRGGKLVGNGFSFTIGQAYKIVNSEDVFMGDPEIFTSMVAACRWVLKKHRPNVKWQSTLKYQNQHIINELDREERPQTNLI